nr:choice-of-anchor A family protein [Melittangium boletus]
MERRKRRSFSVRGRQERLPGGRGRGHQRLRPEERLLHQRAGQLPRRHQHPGRVRPVRHLGQSFSGGINQKSVLFNFVDTTKIEATSYGFWGTILAPHADITFRWRG